MSMMGNFEKELTMDLVTYSAKEDEVERKSREISENLKHDEAVHQHSGLKGAVNNFTQGASDSFQNGMRRLPRQPSYNDGGGYDGPEF